MYVYIYITRKITEHIKHGIKAIKIFEYFFIFICKCIGICFD